MSLRARQKAHTKADASTEAASGYMMPGRALWAQPFPEAIHGEVDGEAVRILVLGDQPGSSPVYLCVDADGTSAIVPLADVTITDGAFLPLRMKKAK
jgi:hypothetical protein